MADTARLWRRRIENGAASRRAACGAAISSCATRTWSPIPSRRCAGSASWSSSTYDPAMLAYHERAEERLGELGDLPAAGGRPGAAGRRAPRRPRARRRGRRPARASAAWREEMSAAERAEFEAVAGELLAELGYDVAS